MSVSAMISKEQLVNYKLEDARMICSDSLTWVPSPPNLDFDVYLISGYKCTENIWGVSQLIFLSSVSGQKYGEFTLCKG